jgi:hypothetical protein
MDKIDIRGIKAGQKCWLLEDRAVWNVCNAEILHVLPHPEDPEDKLIVYRWFGTNKKWWWYGITSASYQEENLDYIKKVVNKRFSDD